MPSLGGFPSEYRHPVWYGKTRMVFIPDCEKNSKICLFILTRITNVTDGQTDRQTPRDGIAALMHSIARQKYNTNNFVTHPTCQLASEPAAVLQLVRRCRVNCQIRHFQRPRFFAATARGWLNV